MNDAKQKEQACYSTLAGMFLSDRMMINRAEDQKDGLCNRVVTAAAAVEDRGAFCEAIVLM